MNNKEKERYARQIMLPEIGEVGQEKLKKAKVLIVGAGGLGTPVALYLAAAGVGLLGLVDNDHVSLTNLQRQVLYHSEVIGEPKVEQAQKVLEKLNPYCKVIPVCERLNDDNADELISSYDLVVDCTDNFRARYLLSRYCRKFGKPMVHGSIEEFRGMVSIFNYQGGPQYDELFPEPPADQSMDGQPKGVFGALPGIVGSMQAMEVLKLISGVGEPLSGKLWTYDALSYQTTVLSIAVTKEQG